MAPQCHQAMHVATWLLLLHIAVCSCAPMPAAAGHQLLVMSYHNCGSSLLAKLLMMLGMHAGDESDLGIAAGNKLKYFELQRVVEANERLLAAHSSPSFPPWLGIGFNLSTVPLSELEKHSFAVTQELEHLERQRPWMVKDPRMLWLAQLWLQRMDTPVCVFMYRHPQEVALRLSTHWFKGHTRNGTVRAHLHAWAHGMHTALNACVGKPTLVLPHALLKADLLMIFVRVLSFELQRAGVPIKPISLDQLHAEVLQHMRAARPPRQTPVQDPPELTPAEAVAEALDLHWDETSDAYAKLAAAMQQHIHKCTMSVDPACHPMHAAKNILTSTSTM